MIVELKNDVAIEGLLKSVDQFLNIKLEAIKVVDPERHPHLVRLRESAMRPTRAHESVYVRTGCGQELLYKRKRCAICSAAERRGRCAITGGCDEER